MRQPRTWEDCVFFHGHECGGLAIGYQASRYAIELLDIEFEEGERIHCIAEGNGCPLDGIQVMLGCTIGKGNLELRPTEARGYNFYNLTTGESARLTLKQLPDMERSKMKEFLLQMTYRYLFDISKTELTPQS